MHHPATNHGQNLTETVRNAPPAATGNSPPETIPVASPPSSSETETSRIPLAYVVGTIVFLVAIVGLVLWRQTAAARELERSTRESAVPSVQIVHPEHSDAMMRLVLPGNVQAYMESPINARVNGYLKRWLVDIGARVKEGDLLAEIDTPEIDQQLNSARATLKQTEADMKLAQITADRWGKLLTDKAVSQQEADEKWSSLEVKKADYASQGANVNRLEDLQSFQKVYAPFDGVITSRKTDVGNLINAGGNTSQELFRIAQTKILRVYVNVPEAYSSYVTVGTTAKIELASNPGSPVTGKLVRTAGAIDPTSHTMLVEIQVPNEDGKLLPGGYAQVHFELKMDPPPLVIPANALIFRAKGAQVGIVDSSGTVHLVAIKIGRDFGTRLEVVQGLKESDSVIINPSDSLVDGARVRVETKPATGTTPPKT